MPYHAIVRNRIREIFMALDRQNTDPFFDSLASDFSYWFIGDSPLGGRRTTRKAMELWWARLFSFFPSAKFVVHDVLVAGWPWCTHAMTYVSIIDNVATPEGQAPYKNEFMQLSVLSWGKVRSVITIEDTAKFNSILPDLFAAGVEAAMAPPILDDPADLSP